MRGKLQSIWRWLRSAVGFLADLGRAAATLAAAAGLVVAAIVLALGVFSGTAMTLLVLGSGLGAFWAVSYFVGPMLRERQPKTVQPKSESSGSSEALTQAERQLDLRRSCREIREELIDNRRILERAIERRVLSDVEIVEISTEVWDEQQAALVEYDDPLPYRRCREAYRRIGLIETRPGGLSARQRTAIEHAFEGIQAALHDLGNAERAA